MNVGSFEFFLNGKEFRKPYEYPQSDTLISPLVLPIPPELLRLGENTLHVRLIAHPQWMQGMPRVTIGKARELEPRIRYWRVLQHDVVPMFAFALVLVGFLALAFWAIDRSDVLFWYGVSGVVFGAITLFLHLNMETTGYRRLWMVSLSFLRFHGVVTPLAIVHLRLTGWRLPWLEGALWALLASVTVLIAMPVGVWRAWSYFGAALFYSILPLLFLIPLVRAKFALRAISRIGLAVAGIGASALGLHDLAIRADILDFDRPRLGHYMFPLFMLAVGAVIVERYLASWHRQREQTAELEARVAEKTREIEAVHAQMRAADEERALVRERRRIMADMHDGLGSRLVGLLSQVQSGKADARQLEDGLTAALGELRTTIDSLQPVEGDLGVVLGNVRHRMRSVFDTAGLELGWRVGELPRIDDLTPARNLAIQRILLELFTNVLKHSGARKVDVFTQARAGKASIVIEDDGRGFDVANRRNGRGLANLQERAREAGGTLVIESEPGRGTRATLALPAAA